MEKALIEWVRETLLYEGFNVVQNIPQLFVFNKDGTLCDLKKVRPIPSICYALQDEGFDASIANDFGESLIVVKNPDGTPGVSVHILRKEQLLKAPPMKEDTCSNH